MAYTASRVMALKMTVPNRPGVLAEIMRGARDAGLDLRALAGMGSDGQGIVIGIPTDPEAARRAAGGAAYKVEAQDVIWVEGDNERGALCPVADKLAAAGVNVQAFQAAAVGGRFTAVIYVADADLAKACQALGI